MPKTKMLEHIFFPRGGKSKQGKGKNGKKGSGKKEGYDLIVHIDLQEWKLSDDMVIRRLVLWKLVLVLWKLETELHLSNFRAI